MVLNKAASFPINSTIQLDLYKSTLSELRVAIASVPGPMVNGFFTFATETHSDDGLPHTLEHLVFMGCKKYPGNLDEITNRCLSKTHACTEQTDTIYELCSAGSNGFLKVLPVYLDYLFDPMLTKSQFITEVHHVDGEGNDNGAIYNEIRDDGNFQRIIDYERKKLFYPQGSSFAADYGGCLKNLRESWVCSLDKVREYHLQFYHLNNLFITVCGIVDHEKLLNEIEKIEAEYIDRIPTDFQRPFQEVLPKLQSKCTKIFYPCDHENDAEFGLVQISWQASPLTDCYKLKALLVLMEYLNEASSKKRKMGAPRTDDECLFEFEMKRTYWEIVANFFSVSIHKMDDKFHEKFLSKLIMDHSKIDVEKIGQIIEQHQRSFLLCLENDAHFMIKDWILQHQLFDEHMDYKQLEERANEMKVFNSLKKERPEFWCELFHEIFTERCICLMAEPSINLYENRVDEEHQRINEQLKILDLKAKREELESAIKENEQNILEEHLLEELIVHDIEQFSLIEVETFQNGMEIMPPNVLPNLPFYYLLHKVQRDIIQVTLIFDTNSISIENRNFLLLWSKLIFQCPAIIDANALSHEEVEKLATRELVSKDISIGVSGHYERFIFFKLCAYNQDFTNLIKWAEIYLKGIKFDEKRVEICARDLDTESRIADTYKIANFLCIASTHNKNSNKFCNCLALQQFHDKIKMKILFGSSEDRANVLMKLEEVRQKVLSSLVNVHFAGDPTKLPAEEDWLNQKWNFLTNPIEKMKFEYDPDYEQNWEWFGKMRAIGTHKSECIFVQKAKFDGTWKDALSPEGNTMEVLLLEKYFCQPGGPVWNALRGPGLSYMTPYIDIFPDKKSILLRMDGYNLNKLIRVYEKTKETMEKILNNGKLDEKLFEEAKRSVIHELISSESTLEEAIESALLASIRNVGPNFTQKLCDRIWTANADDVFRKGAPTIRQLFDDTKSVRCIALNIFKFAELKKAFGKGVEICRLKQFRLLPEFLMDEEEIFVIDDFHMLPEFFKEE